METVKVYSKANPQLVLAIEDGGKVIQAKADPADDSQKWYKDERYSEYKDDEGYPCFALINVKATGQALKHSVQVNRPVELTQYNINLVDGSILWTQGKDLGDGFGAIRMLNNTSLNLQEGETVVVVGEWNGKNEQIWKIEKVTPSNHTSNRKYVKVLSKADPDLLLSIRQGQVVLSRADPTDDFQKWYKDDKYATEYKDMWGFPAFALVNKGIAHALKHSVLPTLPVQLTPYISSLVDGSLLWAQGADLGSGFAAIRMLNNTRINISATDGNVHEGQILVLSEWYDQDNQKWKIETY